ncbi:hypothetical protein [Leptospira jelokensis]|uniref:hypothetical protein n=1 Tax=Leptospira jelokensis TaxID=2484931 RepID=UPI00109107C6|nr:hypothetical protein [Leptospira jelokensis]TGL97937.1 hypothetical protein EHQ79_19005 [Leptospira jelokensis]
MIKRIIEIYRGDTYRGNRGLVFEDIPNLHLPSTTVQFSVKRNPEDDVRVISFPINGSDPGNDWSEPVRRIVVNLETGHTQLLEGGIYFYDIEINYSGEIITVASGEFIVVPDIAKTVHVVSPTTEASIYSNFASTLETLGASLVGVVAFFWDSITGSPSGTVESILQFLWNNKVNRIPTPIGSRLIKSTTEGTYIQETQVSISNEGDVSGIRDLTLGRDLFVPGKIVSQGNLIEGDIIQVKDKNLELGKVNTPSDDTADGGGFTLIGDTNKTFQWLKSKLAWISSESIELISGKQFMVNGLEYVSFKLSELTGSMIAGRVLTSLGSGFAFLPIPTAPVTSVNGKIGDVNLSEDYYSKSEIDSELTNYAELDGTGKIPVSQIPVFNPTVQIVNTIAERNALTPTVNLPVYVKDATGDASVLIGGAFYLYELDSESWLKLSEMESMDIIQSWENIVGKPTSYSAAIIDELSSRRFVSDSEKTLWNNTILDLGNLIGSITFNGFNTNRTIKGTLIGNVTFTSITGGVEGNVYVMTFLQDSTGGRTITFPTNIKIPVGESPDLGANKKSILTMYFDGTNYLGSWKKGWT